MGKSCYDWYSIHTEYVHAVPAISQADLCRKYGMAVHTMWRKVKDGNWDFERASFLRLTSDETTEKKADAVSTFAAEWNNTCVDAAKRLNIKALAEMDAGGKVRDVAAALKIAQDMGKAAAGESPEDTLLSILAGLQKRYE